MATKSLHSQLLDGFSVKSRQDGSVHTIKSTAGTVVAEVCVGTRKVRVNLRTAPKTTPKGLVLGGKSKSWATGVIVTADNVTACRALLDTAVQLAQRSQGAADVAARKIVTRDVRKRVASAARSGVRVTA